MKCPIIKDWIERALSLGCIVCEMPPEVHHMRTGQGKGQRADDKHILPLCPTHHRTGGHGVAFHAGKKTWQELYGTEEELYQKMLERLGE